MIFLLFCREAYCAQDEFDQIKCGEDIPKAVIGKVIKNGKVKAIEAKYINIGLEELGADDLTADEKNAKPFFSNYWKICGDNYVFLEDGNLIRDAMKLPPRTDKQTEYTGKCKIDNKEIPEYVFATVENGVFKNAWKLVQSKGFVKLPTESLKCR